MIYHNRKICPCCGQDFAVPPELTTVNLPGAQRLILFKLHRNKGIVLSIETLASGRATSSIPVQISRLRTAIKDMGLPLRIRTVRDEGYVLEDLV